MLRLAVLLALLVVSPAALAQVGDPAFAVEMDVVERTVEPQKFAVFTATLTSRSSEPMKIWFEQTLHVGRARTVTPLPVVLGAQGERNGELSVLITVQSPYENGRLDETDRVTYLLTPRHPRTNATLDDPQEVTLTLRTLGTYVPGPQFFGVLVALGLAALVLRRRATR